MGDQLLQSIAGRLVECLRGSDTVSRQGGDEFVILLSEVEHAEDAAILELEAGLDAAEAGAVTIRTTARREGEQTVAAEHADEILVGVS